MLSRTPKPADDRSRPEPPAPVSPPTLPPDFPDIPQNPYSELQPPPPPGATPDKVAGTTPAPAEPETQENPTDKATMIEHHGQGERAFGWTFQVSYLSISDVPEDRLYESPYYVGIADQGEAKATLENYVTPLEGIEIKLLSPISASLAASLGLRTNEIKQE